MQLSGRNQSHHSSRNFISRVSVGTLKNPNQFHQDFSANKGGLLGAAVIHYILRNLKLLQVTCVKRRTRTLVFRAIDMPMTSHLQQPLRQIQTLDLVFPTFLIVRLHTAPSGCELRHPTQCRNVSPASIFRAARTAVGSVVCPFDVTLGFCIS